MKLKFPTKRVEETPAKWELFDYSLSAYAGLSCFPYAYSILRYLPICSHLLFSKALFKLDRSLSFTKQSPLDLFVFLSFKMLQDSAEQNVLKNSKTSSSVAS